MTKDELHILPTDVRLTCLHFTEKTEPTRQSNPEEEADQSKTRRSPRSLSEHSLLRRGTTKTLSTLILSKTYPSMDQGRRQGGGQGPGPPMVPKFPLEI